jgi:acetyl-CoA carboxylase carboxyltransferase component
VPTVCWPTVRFSRVRPWTADVQQPSSPTDTPASSNPTETPIRADLQALLERRALTLDSARPEAVAKRHAQGGRMVRENIGDLCDAGSFVEYGALAFAAQERRRSREDLWANTPADGMVCGTASVNGALFAPADARCAVMGYDATVLAGTQGARNHAKTDRLLHIALDQGLPVVLWAEGGGGRPGDVDMPIVAGLHVGTFAAYARLSGQVPVVGIAAGRCFAGNAALLGCSDVMIATESSNVGMGGPAMIEGAGLGVLAPEDVGPASVQHANGVIDILVKNEAQAVSAAKQYLSYFQSARSQTLLPWEAPNALALRQAVPENRLRAYDTQSVLQGLADVGSVLPLRSGFGLGIHTALARIEGRAVGVLANNPLHLSGAIDADAADKAARFMQLCDAHGLPLISLIDTPGFMVGAQSESQAQVRHVSRMFVVAAQLRVPVLAVVLRKAYGLGAMAMAAGSLHAPTMTVGWPSAEFGAMGLEGAVRLGYRKELEQLSGDAREQRYQDLLAQQYAQGSALNMAAHLEIDAVIDPADTRAHLVRCLHSAKVQAARTGRFIDTW